MRTGTFEHLAAELARCIEPLHHLLHPDTILDLFAELGLRFSTFPAPSAEAAAKAADDVRIAAVAMETAFNSGTAADIVAKGKAAVAAVKAFQTALDEVVTDLHKLTPPQITPTEWTNFARDFKKNLIDYAVVLHLEWSHPRILHALRFLGIVEREHVDGGPNVAHPPFIRRRIHFKRVKELADSPEQLLRVLYGWGEQTIGTAPGTFRALQLLDRVTTFLEHVAFIPELGETGELDLDGLIVRPAPALAPPGLELVVYEPIAASLKTTTPTYWPSFNIEQTVTLTLDPGVKITLQPPGKAAAVPAPGGPSLKGAIVSSFHGLPPANDPYLILGCADGTRIEASEAEVRGFAVFESEGGKSRVTLGGEASARGRAVLGVAGADSFLSGLFPADGLGVDLDTAIGYTTQRGFFFKGGASLRAEIPVHKSVGVFTLRSLSIVFGANDSAVSLETAATGSVEIGPVTCVVERVGATTRLAFTDGNLGPADLQFAFRPPSGLGIDIAAGPVSGGGYLYYDEASGRYSGALQLQLKNIAVKAVGILDTRLPGEEKGYSFLMIVSAEFPPLQLGMGFTLNGAGGIAGLHRTMAIAELQTGLRSRSLDQVLFPKDPIASAPRIAADLQRLFPPKQRHHVFGPAALIGWGTPTLVTIELGIVMELPPPVIVVLLGQVHCVLPKPETSVVKLHVDVLGVLDAGAQTFALDGILHGSRVGPFPIDGDFAVRLRWGSDPAFALSIGGFHPAFRQIPPGFPSLRRITLALSAGNNPRLTLQCYLAVTSNSLQFGARADLYSEAGRFNIAGWLGFDVLVLFRPFHFRADISAGFALRRGTSPIAAIYVDATLTGPAPWHVWGDASLRIFGFKVKVSFDATFGDAVHEPLPSTVIWSALQPALVEAKNWRGVLPPAASQVVSFGGEWSGDVLLDPVTRITVLQRTAPLQRSVSRFAEGVPSGARRFALDEVSVGGKTISGWRWSDEHFAPAQFEALTDDQRLSRRSFERMHAGMSLPDAVTHGTPIGKNLAFETTVVDGPYENHRVGDYVPSLQLQQAQTLAGAATRRTRRFDEPSKPRVTFDEGAFG